MSDMSGPNEEVERKFPGTDLTKLEVGEFLFGFMIANQWVLWSMESVALCLKIQYPQLEKTNLQATVEATFMTLFEEGCLVKWKQLGNMASNFFTVYLSQWLSEDKDRWLLAEIEGRDHWLTECIYCHNPTSMPEDEKYAILGLYKGSFDYVKPPKNYRLTFCDECARKVTKQSAHMHVDTTTQDKHILKAYVKQANNFILHRKGVKQVEWDTSEKQNKKARSS